MNAIEILSRSSRSSTTTLSLSRGRDLKVPTTLARHRNVTNFFPLRYGSAHRRPSLPNVYYSVKQGFNSAQRYEEYLDVWSNND